MNSHQRKLVSIVIALAALLPLATASVGQAQAQAVSTTITGTEAPCDPNNPFIAPGVSTPQPDGTTHVEGMILRLCDATNDPRTTGENIVVLNANWDADGLGPMWGTWYLVPKVLTSAFTTTPKPGGSWSGAWTGFSLASGAEKAVILATGRGAGPYAGLKYAFTIQNGAIQGRVTQAPTTK
jgi:hypothetical protein